MRSIITSLVKGAVATGAFVCLTGVASVQPAYAEDFNKLSVFLTSGVSMDGVANTYQSDKVSLTGGKIGLTATDGLEASWGGIVRIGATAYDAVASNSTSRTFQFWKPTDTSVGTGVGTQSTAMSNGFGWRVFADLGYRLNPYVAVFARGGWECSGLSWKQTWDYAGVYDTSVDKNSTNMCGPIVGGSVAIDPPLQFFPPLSIGAYYRYAEGQRETYTSNTIRDVSGPTQGSLVLELSMRVPVEHLL